MRIKEIEAIARRELPADAAERLMEAIRDAAPEAPRERLTDEQVFAQAFPPEVVGGEFYRVPCDDKGRNGGSWLQVMVSPHDGDVYVSMQDWERMPEGNPKPFPSIRVRTGFGGGRNQRTRQALLWLARAIQLDGEEAEARGGWS